MAQRLQLLLLLAGLVATAVQASESADNLLEGASLATPLAATGLPTGWQALGESRFAASVTANEGRTGDAALVVESSGPWAEVCTSPVKFDPRKRYLACGWVQVEGESQVQAKLLFEYQDADDKLLGRSDTGAVTTASKGWQQVRLADHAGQFPGTTTIRIACRVDSATGKARFGELRVLERPNGGADDLLRDGSCEEGIGDTLACWHLAQPRGGTVSIGACMENPRDGAACMSLRGIADWACGESERIAVVKGKVHTLRGWARATRGDVFLQISYWRGNEWLGLTQSDAVTTDGQWQECVASTEPDRFADATHVSISGTARGGNVEAWFDAMVFTPETSHGTP